MKKIQINVCEYPEDIKRIQKILENKGYEATVEQCEKLWQKYSDMMCAGWMRLDDNDEDVFEHINAYIEN